MIRALNLPSHGQDVWAGAFPRVYCGNKALLSLWAILLVLAAEGLFCGSGVGLWRADLERNSRMIRGIRVSRGPLGLFSCKRKGVCIAALLLCGFKNKIKVNERQLSDLQGKNPPQRWQKKTGISHKEHFYWKFFMVKITGWLSFVITKNYNLYITIVSINICCIFLMLSCLCFL